MWRAMQERLVLSVVIATLAVGYISGFSIVPRTSDTVHDELYTGNMADSADANSNYDAQLSSEEQSRDLRPMTSRRPAWEEDEGDAAASDEETGELTDADLAALRQWLVHTANRSHRSRQKLHVLIDYLLAARQHTADTVVKRQLYNGFIPVRG